MKKLIILIIVVAVIAIGGYYIANQNSPVANEPGDAMNEEGGAMEEPGGTAMENEPGGAMMEGEVKNFNVTATNFRFSEAEMRVKKGDTVRITLNVQEGFHDWVIDEFSARTQQMQAGGTQTIEFVADQTGQFEYYCSVGQHRQMGMVGTLIVEE
jgi:cytochrome c oxidase subunit 2